MKNKIIAQRDLQYLIKVNSSIGRILDLDQSVLFPSQNLQSIFKFGGYWETYTEEKTFEELMEENEITIIEDES